MGWIRAYAPLTYARIQEADRKSVERLGHETRSRRCITTSSCRSRVPNRITQIRWGIRDFESHFDRKPEAMWLAETAINMDVVVDLIREALSSNDPFPTQAESFHNSARKNGGLRRYGYRYDAPYRISRRTRTGTLSAKGILTCFLQSVAFEARWASSTSGDANVFGRRITDAWDPNRRIRSS